MKRSPKAKLGAKRVNRILKQVCEVGLPSRKAREVVGIEFNPPTELPPSVDSQFRTAMKKWIANELKIIEKYLKTNDTTSESMEKLLTTRSLPASGSKWPWDTNDACGNDLPWRNYWRKLFNHTAWGVAGPKFDRELAKIAKGKDLTPEILDRLTETVTGMRYSSYPSDAAKEALLKKTFGRSDKIRDLAEALFYANLTGKDYPDFTNLRDINRAGRLPVEDPKLWAWHPADDFWATDEVAALASESVTLLSFFYRNLPTHYTLSQLRTKGVLSNDPEGEALKWCMERLVESGIILRKSTGFVAEPYVYYFNCKKYLKKYKREILPKHLPLQRPLTEKQLVGFRKLKGKRSSK